MNVSVLICSRDRPKVLLRCLQSVLKQDYSPIEVLVLDDASSRCRLIDLISSSFRDPRLFCFRSDTSLGVAGARNLLMRKARGDIFCAIDDDAYFADSGCISRIVDAFERNPGLGILAFKIIHHRAGGKELLVPFSRRWRRKRPYLTEQRGLVSYYIGACHAILRCVTKRCGVYQDDLMYGEEELDLSYRAIEMGFQIMYLPSVVAHHYPQPSLMVGQGGRDRSELYYHVRNRLYLSYRYLPWVCVPVHLGIWLSAHALSALKQFAVREFVRGVVDGLKYLKQTKRISLSEESVRYLKAHYGRLWY